MIFLAKSLSHQPHHLDRTCRNAQGIHSIPRINGSMCRFTPDSNTFGTVTVARRISQVKILLNRNHMNMCREYNIRIIKNTCSNHFALAAAEFCSFFLKTDTFICINIFLSRNCKKRKASAKFFLDFCICQCRCTAYHCCHLCVMPAGMCHTGNRVRHRMCPTADCIHLSDDRQMRSFCRMTVTTYTSPCKMLRHLIS